MKNNFMNIMKISIIVSMGLFVFSGQCCAESENAVYQETNVKDTVQIPDDDVSNMATAAETHLDSETDEKMTESHDNGLEEEAFRQWIAGNLESSFGVCEKGSFSSENSRETYGWCQQQGVVNSYCADFNGNGQKECLTIYLDNSDEGDISCKDLHLAVLTAGDSGIKKFHDVVLQRMDSTAAVDLRVYIVESNGLKYIVLQRFIPFNGCAEDIFVFHITKRGRMCLDNWIQDPGYTSATALLRVGLTGIVDNLKWNEDIKKIILYEVDIDAYCAGQPMYGEIMNNVLEEYGISVSVSETMQGYKMWLFDEKNNMKKILHIYCDHESQGDMWKYNYTISDGEKTDLVESF